MARVCVFDVNETLLDLKALDAHFGRVFGDAGVRQVWFAQMIQSALVATVTDAYADFGALGGAALDMMAARRDSRLASMDRAQILGGMRTLPAHPEVAESLARLRRAGLRLAALTNSTLAVATDQLTHAGLAGYFEQILSADMVRRLKPAPEPYLMAAERMGVAIGDIRMIAAHAWDIAGARRAGCAAAFVARPGMVLDPLALPPDIVGATMREVADQILALELATE
ncbi:MAG: haloacid dehalogenase type II [Roseiflexaceae bacterium]